MTREYIKPGQPVIITISKKYKLKVQPPNIVTMISASEIDAMHFYDSLKKILSPNEFYALIFARDDKSIASSFIAIYDGEDIIVESTAIQF